ncbi:MAG: PBECR4 domain-containing protein [Erysipelotrichaceae bacterium]
MNKNDTEIQREIYSLIKEPFEVFDKFIYYDYAFITENHKVYIGKFQKRDFLHLIGISVYPMDNRKFYNNYKDGKTNYSLINLKKTYNRSTIIKKSL